MARFKFSKVYQYNGDSVDIFYNRILKTVRQCEFPDMDDCIIDAIIFGTNCIKAQGKLLQTPKTLSLQQCLSVVWHYESLKLHIQQIRPDKNINYLRQHHSSKKKTTQNQGNFHTGKSNQNQHQGCSQSHSRQGQYQNQNQQKTTLHRNQCFGCGQDRHQDVKSECPAFGKTCHKCGRNNHFVSVCGKIPYRKSGFQSKSRGRQTSVNELNQSNHDSGATLTSMSIPRNTEYGHTNTVPKQVLDVVNLANKGNNGTNL